MRQRLIHTPRYDAWLDRLRRSLSPAGAKTELANFMAGERGQSLQVWKVNLARITRTGSVINAEDLLAITAWMDGRNPSRHSPKGDAGSPPKRRSDV